MYIYYVSIKLEKKALLKKKKTGEGVGSEPDFWQAREHNPSGRCQRQVVPVPGGWGLGSARWAVGPVVDVESTSGVGPILGVCSQLEGAGPHRWARFLI